MNLDPSNIELLQSKARLASLLKENQLAIETYHKILDLTAHNDQAKTVDLLVIFKQIGSLQNQEHNYPDAIKTYEQALQIYPQDATLYQDLSQTYAAAGLPDKAMQAINTALELSPDNVSYLKSKATLATWLKDNQLAIETYQKFWSSAKMIVKK